MDGPHIRLTMNEVRELAGKDKQLEKLIKTKLDALAAFYYLPEGFMHHLAEDVMTKIKEEAIKIRGGRDPYPQVIYNGLSVQVTMPTAGKIGVASWDSKTEV